LLVSVTGRELLPPTATFPKLTLAGFEEICARVPVPLNAIASGEPGALLVIETLPLAAVAVVGANLTLNEAACPGFRVCGVVSVVARVKPVPLMLPAVIVRAAVPEFDNVTDTVEVLPTRRFPKLMLAGFGVSAACKPVPLSGIDNDGLVAVDVTVISPEIAPVPVGAKVAVSDAVAPAAMVCPALIPLALNPEPVVLT
jgi:hypothetical protein